mmetsp:Transcript_82884/g.231158  ORF Transcript_82884/g.231158 Transcript_82884/m.231158 type:complete len:261 (-) Transcript_82884:226-1008(-)
MEMPMTLPAPSFMIAAKAVTSPSLMTRRGGSPNSFARRLKMSTTFALYTSGGTLGKMSHHVASLSKPTVPVALPPMASTCGSFVAVSFKAFRITFQWYSGSGFVTSHSVSLDSRTWLSCTATVFTSLLPRSKASRQPEASLPQTIGSSLAGGISSGLQTTLTSKGVSGVPHTFGIVFTSNANLPSGEKACASACACFGGPEIQRRNPLRSQNIIWIKMPQRWMDASTSGWSSAKTGNLSRPQRPPVRSNAHSTVWGLPVT